MYVADGGNNTVRTMVQGGTNWVVLTIAGRAGYGGAADGTNNSARFNYPSGAAPDSTGNIYVTDQIVSTIRKLAPEGTNWVVSTIAGQAGYTGTVDGTNSGARFNRPGGLAVDGGGAIYVADSWNNAIRKLSLWGTNWVASTIGGLCGTTNYGLTDGIGSAARFNYPNGVALDSRGNVYVADFNNNAIRRGIPLPVFQTTTLTNDMLTLTWSAAVGQILQVQYTTDLGQTNWTNLGDQFVCTSSTVSVPDSVASDAQRLYRVLVTP
jgi:sugar lactone lactonase YvrE